MVMFQDTFEEEAATVSEASWAPPGLELGHSCLETKQEEDGEGSLLGKWIGYLLVYQKTKWVRDVWK
ncbi:UNVERIFIED_CONTAM: hypothetical protein K2H54_062395 [Gekko kuhli]